MGSTPLKSRGDPSLSTPSSRTVGGAGRSQARTQALSQRVAFESGYWRLVIVVIVLALSSVACSDSSEADEGQSAISLDCANPIDILDAPPPGWTSVLDVIALPEDQILQRGRFDDQIGRWFSKFGLVIRADRTFTVSVAQASQANAVMSWNSGSGAPVASIDITSCSGVCQTDFQPNCPLGESGEWVVYPGGVWTIEPDCIALEIAVDGQTATARLPIGVQCT